MITCALFMHLHLNLQLKNPGVGGVLFLLTHWPLGDPNAILKMQFSILFYWLASSDLLMIMPSNKWHRTLLMINQHWFRWWLGAVRQQAITWANVDSVSCLLMASLGHNGLTDYSLAMPYAIIKLGQQSFRSQIVTWAHQGPLLLDK